MSTRLVMVMGCLLILSYMDAQSLGRLENEYKLSVPQDELQELWEYLQNISEQGEVNFDGNAFSGTNSEERFDDLYFDTQDKYLLHNNIGLRYRKRYINNILEKELIQLKAPTESSDLVRSEDKFYVDDKSGRTSLKTRHPFLKYVKRSDRDQLDFQLRLLNISSEDLTESVRLRQIRRRVYLSDSLGSMATITLDQVRNQDFPYQRYAEMEIELNEIRYTQEDSIGRSFMDGLNESIRNTIQSNFPSLQQDQTPKYNKMYALIEHNTLSWLRYNWANVSYVFIILIGVYSAWSLNVNQRS